MGNTIKPYHSATESTMVFDSHPCTPKAARRAYDGQPTVCSVNEYSDIFAKATDAFVNVVDYCGCCFGPPGRRHRRRLLDDLKNQYKHLDLIIEEHWRAGRWQFVLKIRRVVRRTPTAHPSASLTSSASSPPPSSPMYHPPSGGGGGDKTPTIHPTAPPASWDDSKHTTAVPIVQAVPVQDIKRT